MGVARSGLWAPAYYLEGSGTTYHLGSVNLNQSYYDRKELICV